VKSYSEAEVAAVVVAWLEALGADVYQEVECGTGVADIVARVRAELWIVEVKTSLSFALLLQAMERRRESHRVFVAAPYTRNQRRATEIFDDLGIGLLEVRVGDGGWNQPHVREVVQGRRWNSRPVALAARLKPEHKTHAKAGAIGAGGRWTPFRDTCEQLARIVAATPCITVKDAVEQLRHHYRTQASARNSIAHWVSHGRVPGVTLAIEDGRTVLKPTETR
jgi:hypothetical protein